MHCSVFSTLSLLLFLVFLTLNMVEAQPAKAEDILHIPTPDSVSGPVLYWLAEDLGFAAEEHLKFDYVGVVPSGQLVASVVAGKIDIGGAHINRTIAGISAGARVTAVAANSETRPDIPHMAFMVLNNSPIKRGQDLLGKKIGLAAAGGCNEYTPYAWMMKDGIAQPKGKYQLILVPVANLEQSLRQGNIDVAGIHSNPDILVEHGGLRTAFTDWEIWQDKGGNTPAYFSNKFIAEKPDVVRRFVAVWAKTIDWSNSHPKESIQMTKARALREKIPVLDENLRWIWYAPHAIIKKETVDVWLDILKKMGDVKPAVQAKDCYTNKFNPYWKPSTKEPY